MQCTSDNAVKAIKGKIAIWNPRLILLVFVRLTQIQVLDVLYHLQSTRCCSVIVVCIESMCCMRNLHNHYQERVNAQAAKLWVKSTIFRGGSLLLASESFIWQQWVVCCEKHTVKLYQEKGNLFGTSLLCADQLMLQILAFSLKSFKNIFALVLYQIAFDKTHLFKIHV